MAGPGKSLAGAALLLIGVLVVLPLSGQRASGQFLSHDHPVSTREIKIGMSNAESGRIGLLGVDIRQGCEAYLARINKRGGVKNKSFIGHLSQPSRALDCEPKGPIPLSPTKTAADFIKPICCSSAVCQEVPGLISLSSSHGLMPSLTNFCAISRTAGLSSLLWHRKTSKISALGSCPFTQRQFYREKIRRRQIIFAAPASRIADFSRKYKITKITPLRE